MSSNLFIHCIFKNHLQNARKSLPQLSLIDLQIWVHVVKFSSYE
jgi:hypothetical protein